MGFFSKMLDKVKLKTSNAKVGFGRSDMLQRDHSRTTKFIGQMWHTLLTSEVLECMQVSEDETNDLISLMSDSKIDPEKFSGNLEVLLTGSNRSGYGRKALTSTPSVCKFMFSLDRPLGFPLWFLAGFPDVAAWATDGEGLSYLARTDENEYLETIGFHYFQGLISSYVDKAGRSLEAAFQEDSANDLHLAGEIFEATGEENNATLIASMTTKYYLEAKRSYGTSFNNETALLSMAGVLDANAYIFVTRQLTVTQIVTVARQTEGMQDRMQEFLIRFETLLLSQDNPEYSPEEVREACESEAEAIRRTVLRTTKTYVSEPAIFQSVRTMMLSSQFSELRQEIGVSTAKS